MSDEIPDVTDQTTDQTTAEGATIAGLSPEDRASLLAEFQAEQRKIEAMRPTGVEGNKSPEQVAQERMQHPYYCPGCGRTADFLRECVGGTNAPHAPIVVVSTAELDGDPGDHTAAPDSP